MDKSAKSMLGDLRQSTKARLIGRLSGKDKKADNNDDDDNVSAFLKGPSDKLYMSTPEPQNPPLLTRLDTSSAKRWPAATDVSRSRDSSRGPPPNPRRSRKGLSVRFTDQQPEIMGEGGDEAEDPVSYISVRRRAQSHLPNGQQRQNSGISTGASRPAPGYREQSNDSIGFRPQPLRRAQTGHHSIPENQMDHTQIPIPIEEAKKEDFSSTGFLKAEPSNPTSFAARVQAEMRASEGHALTNGFKTPSPELNRPDGQPMSRSGSGIRAPPEMILPEGQSMSRSGSGVRVSPEMNPVVGQPMSRSRSGSGVGSQPPPASHGLDPNRQASMSNKMQHLNIAPQSTRSGPPSPGQVLPQLTPGLSQPVEFGYGSKGPNALHSSPDSKTATPSSYHGDDDSLEDFDSRVHHFYKLFMLAAESVMPLSRSSFEDLIRAASWWFLRGRANIEMAVKARPTSPDGMQRNVLLRQQGHADLAKSLWIVSEVIPQRPELGGSTLSNIADLALSARELGDDYMADILERCQAVLANLRKLTLSMKRNGLLPPTMDEAPLMAGIDNTVWIKYPQGTPDTYALLSGKGGSLIASDSLPTVKVSEAMPIGDSSTSFNYARMFVDVFLMEERVESQQFRCPAILSISRNSKEKDLSIMVASQNGMVALSVTSNKGNGPTWNDVRWQSRITAIEIKLPRGFIARIQCSPSDYSMLWGMYDYTSKIHGQVHARRDEEIIFETTVKTFQYFDRDPNSRIFPKDPCPGCRVRILEKKLTEVAGTGARSKHRGYRIVVVTHPSTKNLSGVSHEMPPGLPVLFGFMRGEGGDPALLLKIDDGIQKATMVMCFEDVERRTQVHCCLTGEARDDEAILVKLPIKAFSFGDPASSDSKLSKTSLSSLEWQNVRVVNQPGEIEGDVETTKTVLSEHLRIITDSRTGILTDRINTGPGELKIRLGCQPSNHEICILRQQQEDMTVSLSESQVPRTMPLDATEFLSNISKSDSLRTYRFANSHDLHKFQAAITGFTVLFDGLASSFAISRRRMVVPIYKKLDASVARIQLLRQEKTVQISAFFENFSYGECMNFVLKSTDVFESFAKNDKFSLRITDAKFALPKGGEDYNGNDKAFVCLDSPEYPGEHDDVTISFDSEADRDRFASVLPAPVKIVSRLGTVRR